MRVSVRLLVFLVACGPSKSITGEGSGTGAGNSGIPGVTTGATSEGPGDSGSGSTTPCVPGRLVECPCPDGSTGTQTCQPDGQSFGPCECGGDTSSGSDGTGVPPDGTGTVTSTEVTCRPPEDPYPGNAAIESNDDVATYSEYSVIAGKLSISGAVTSLEGLDCLTLIGGQVYLGETTLLRDLSGLDNLERIQGELEVGSNNGLESFDGLGALSRVGYLSIYENLSLASIDGMSALAIVDGAVEIGRNPSLPTCDILAFLDGLDSYGGHCVRDNLADDCPDEC